MKKGLSVFIVVAAVLLVGVTAASAFYVTECALVVEKFCSVPEAPEPFVCSDAKPIDSLTMIWDGTKTISQIDVYRDKFDPNDPAKNFMYTIDGPIDQGGEVTADGYTAANAPNDVDWHIIFADGSDGISRFHRSCSDADMNGPEDCGKNEGNAKSTDSSFVNDWLFEGMAGNGLTLACTPEDPILSRVCEVFAVKPGSCADGKPTALVFQYTGDACVDGNDQPSDKWSCSGDASGAEPVQVVITKDADKFMVIPSDETIYVGDTFEIRKIDGGDFPSEIKFEIRQGNVALQSLKIHTSCSEPLNVGDQFGSVILEQFIPKGSTAPSENVIYTYMITNNGAAQVTVKVVDNQLGVIEGDLAIPGYETVELTKPALLTEPGEVANVVKVTDVNYPDCYDEDEVTVTVVEPPEACDDQSKVQVVTAEYTGEDCQNPLANPQGGKATCAGDPAFTDPVYIIAASKSNLGDSKTKIWFSGEVPLDGSFAIDAGSSKLDSDTHVFIYESEGGVLLQYVKFHTSCSQPLAEGDQFGSLFVEDLTLIPK